MCLSPKKLKLLTEVPYVVDVKVDVPSFKMIPCSSPQLVPTTSYPFGGSLGDQVKGRTPKKAKIADGGSICSALERTGYNLQ